MENEEKVAYDSIDESLDIRESENLASLLKGANVSASHLDGAPSIYGVDKNGDYKISKVSLKKYDISGNKGSFVVVELEGGGKLSLSACTGFKPVYDTVEDAKNAVRRSTRINDGKQSDIAVLPSNKALSLAFDANYIKAIPNLVGTIHVERVDGYKLAKFGLTAETSEKLEDARKQVVPTVYYNLSKVA